MMVNHKDRIELEHIPTSPQLKLAQSKALSLFNSMVQPCGAQRNHDYEFCIYTAILPA